MSASIMPTTVTTATVGAEADDFFFPPFFPPSPVFFFSTVMSDLAMVLKAAQSPSAVCWTQTRWFTPTVRPAKCTTPKTTDELAGHTFSDLYLRTVRVRIFVVRIELFSGF